MNLLRGVLYFFAGVFLLIPATIFLEWHHVWSGLILAGGAALSYATFRQAQKFNVRQSDSQKLQLEQIYRQLAEKNAGLVPVSALMNATGQSKDQVQHNMRELVGRGICDLDFSATGEMQYKLTPFDQARAELAEFREK